MLFQLSIEGIPFSKPQRDVRGLEVEHLANGSDDLTDDGKLLARLSGPASNSTFAQHFGDIAGNIRKRNTFRYSKSKVTSEARALIGEPSLSLF